MSATMTTIGGLIKSRETYHPESQERKQCDDLLQVFKAFTFTGADYEDYVDPTREFTAMAGSASLFLKKEEQVGRSKFILLRTVAAQVDFMLKNGYSPHLVKIHEVQAAQVPLEDPKRKYEVYHLYTLMERLEGDLAEHSQRFSKLEWAAFAIQLGCTEAIAVLRVQLCPRDLKTRNVVWKKLDESDQTAGQKLQDFDYWKYKIGEQEFYIPRLNYLIKFCDYSLWAPMTNEFDDFTLESAADCVQKWLMGFSGITLEDAKKLFPAPEGSENKILDVVIDGEELSTPFDITTRNLKKHTEEMEEVPLKPSSMIFKEIE